MTKRIFILLSCFLFTAVSFAQSDVATELGIVPRPKNISRLAGNDFKIDSQTSIYHDKASSSVAEYLQSTLQTSTSFSISTKKSKASTSGKGIYLSIDPSLNLKAEGYKLKVTDNEISITGKSTSGVFYGVQTLLQLLPTQIYSPEILYGLTWNVPAVDITDEPYFEEFRGLHVDLSRHFFSKETLLQLIDMIAIHKLNIFHLHLTDDDGWRMEIKAYPKLTEIGAIGNRSNPTGKGPRSFFTQKDLKEIIAYAKSRYITVLPEIDMPGHMKAAIRAYPELKCPAEPRKTPKVINNNEYALNFCKQVLKEVRDVFGEVPIHVGFDEVNLGLKTPIYNDEEITAIAREITTYIKDKLKTTPIVWDDAFEKGLEDKDVLVQWWRPGKKAWWKHLEMTMDQKLQKYDQPFILSPGNYTYLDMTNADGFDGARWAGIVSVDKIYNWEPMLDLVDADVSKRHLAKGVITCTWSEKIPDVITLQSRIFPRLAAFAEKGWSQPADVDTAKPSWEVWRDKVLMAKQLNRYKALQINYWGRNQPSVIKNVKNGKF
ncbi:hypothetical protein EYV94_20875 [Puteibacter caeruleilacunae]|nr:hypothetical protein EYV94_20875 [Puteibacter caeruleilacunae]